MMTFDTAAAIQTLIDRGIKAEEASAIVRVLVDSQRDLVTKYDLTLALMPFKIGGGLIGAGVLSLVLKAYF